MDLPVAATDPLELLRLVKHLNLGSVARRVGVEGCYSLLWPEVLTECWVTEHVHDVFVDERDTLAVSCRSVTNNALLTKLLATCLRIPPRALYGHELRLPVKKKKCDSCCSLDTFELPLKLYHYIRDNTCVQH